MEKSPAHPAMPHPGNINRILEWLAAPNHDERPKAAEELLDLLITLRETPVSMAQRVKFLDLIQTHVERLSESEIKHLDAVSLPLSKSSRQRIKRVLKLLETLTQDYFNNLASLFDPQTTRPSLLPQLTLYRAVQAIAWQIRIHHLIASPDPRGLWQQFHAALRTARQLGVDNQPGPHGGPSLHRIYANNLLIAVAQPASFSSDQLNFIRRYVESLDQTLILTTTPPASTEATFWIDPEQDFSAHALVRRKPAEAIDALYFSCEQHAALAAAHCNAARETDAAQQLGLPEFAASRAGRGALRRLQNLWGHPAKRKFPRRRQSYRVKLLSGFEALSGLLSTTSAEPQLSEWMVINESADGFSLMHMAGDIDKLRIGELVALETTGETTIRKTERIICVLRWAVSDNPEHIEIGLQQIASGATVVQVATPESAQPALLPALLLPASPSLNNAPGLIIEAGRGVQEADAVIILIESDRLAIRESQAGSLIEQNDAIEIFTLDDARAA